MSFRASLLCWAVLGLLLLMSGCVAMQEDVLGLHDRLLKVETRLTALERETRGAHISFSEEWTRKLAALSEDMIRLRERISTADGKVDSLVDQLTRETERSERFRVSSIRELEDFQRGFSTRLETFQEEQAGHREELAALKKAQEKNLDILEAFQEHLAFLEEGQDNFSARLVQVDTALELQQEETVQKLDIVLQEITEENQALRERITALERKTTAAEKKISALEQKLSGIEKTPSR